MATIKHAIEEHDVVALRVPVGSRPAGTSGTVVGLYDVAALVEVAEDEPPGSALDNLLTVPFEDSSCGGVAARVGSKAWKPDGSLCRRDPTVR